jgi:ribosomal protein S18 acetylase RimI-like enzyme
MNGVFSIRQVDYTHPADATALVALLDAYATDPAGGATPLSDDVKARLAAELARRPQAFSVIAWHGDQAVGLVNAIEGFSTFKAQMLVNVHDVAVLPAYRGQGVAAQMLRVVERMARERGACKLTLECLDGNQAAMTLYRRLGFAGYELDPAMGQARFMQKWLD